MSKPSVGPWQSSNSGRRGRYLTQDGVRFFQWEDENTLQRVDPQPTVQQSRSRIRYDPSPSDLGQVQTPNTRPEQLSPQSASAYAVAPGRHGPSQGSAYSSAQGYGINGEQSSQTAPYRLFDRGDDEQQGDVATSPPSQASDLARPSTRSESNGRGGQGRPTTYNTTQRGMPVDYTAATRHVSSPASSGPPQASPRRLDRPNTTQLSKLAFEFTQLVYGDYSSCEAFISKNPDILKEDPNSLLQEAIRLEREGKHSQAKACLQQSLLLRKCLKISRDARQAFFSHLRSKDQKVLNDFLDDYDKAISAVRKAAKTDPAGINAGTNTRNAPEAPRRGTINDELSSAMQRVSVSHPHGPDQTSTLGARNVNQEPTVTSAAARPDIGPRRPTVELEADENSTVGAPSIEEFIKGTDQDREDLDPRYYKRPDARKFFTVGRVFALLWHESAGEGKSGREGYIDHSTEARYGQRVFSHIRRMAVVKERQGYCVCIPINTYGGQGVLKPGLGLAERQAHSVIHATDKIPYSREQEKPFLVKKPIAVNMATREQQLDKMSRINFGKPNSVEWNVKVMNVGRVAPESMATFTGYYYNEYSN